MHHCTNANAEVSSGRFFAGPRGVSIAAFGNMGPLSSTEQKGKDCHDQDKQATRGTRLYHGAQSPLRVRSDVLFQLPIRETPTPSPIISISVPKTNRSCASVSHLATLRDQEEPVM